MTSAILAEAGPGLLACTRISALAALDRPIGPALTPVMDTLTDLHEARMAAVLDTLHATRTLDRLERRDWLVFRRIASLVEGLPIADVVDEGEPELYGHWLDAQVRWRDLGLGHMTLAAVEREMKARGVAR